MISIHNVVSADRICSKAIAKKWHTSVNQNLRSYMVHRLCKAITNQCDSDKLLPLTRRVEGEIYAAANSTAEYYHLLAVEAYNTQKDLMENFRINKKI